MAMLRCPSASVVKLAFARASFLARGIVGLSLLFLCAISVTAAEQTDDSKPGTAPRTLLRLPRWIESLGERAARKPAQQPAASDRKSSPRGPLATSPQAVASQPLAPKALATQPSDERFLEPITTEETLETEQANEIDIASTPASSSEGKPGRALLRSRTAAELDAHTTLTSGWGDLLGETTGTTLGADSDSLDLTDEPTPAKPNLGPETSVLKREALEHVAVQPQPTIAAAPSSARSSDSKTFTPPEQATPEQIPQEKKSVPAIAQQISSIPVQAEHGSGSIPPIATPPEETPTLAIDPASFRGVYPGKTTREELESGWGAGEPFTRQDGEAGFFWEIEPFDRIEVTLDGDTVGSIRIKLADPVAVSELSKQLEIADLRTVSILDEDGVSIGEVFPERGVIFSVNPGTQSATAVMLEPLDPESFVLRSEGEMSESVAFAIADLHYAIEIDPKHLRAHRLLLVLMCEQGRWQQASRLAAAAETLDPLDIWTRLKHASVLMALNRLEDAREKVAGVKAQENVSPLVTAQADRMLGRIALASTSPDYQKAVSHFEEAIRKATPLASNRSTSIQKAARDVLLDAHLGTALAIARGTWQQKSRVIPKWIARSEAILSEVKSDDADRDMMELQLCRGALAASAGSADSIDALPWVKRLLETRDRLGEHTSDPWRQRQIDWEIGEGLSDALVASQKRGDASDMLDNATLTAAYLERGATRRELTDAERRNVGDLLFRIGILHSLQKGDHATAVTWFDKAVPLWNNNPSFATQGELGRLGESFVSMAISYWQVERREDALAISRKGVDFMVEAVDQKQLEERSLAVAYGNLSTMYAEEGDSDQSKTYAEMASRAEATGTKLQ